MKATQEKQGPSLFASASFRWLFGGALISQLGDQFTMIALPWLVLTLTGDTLALGTVMALMAVPRALFILVGGALVDRFSPKSVLLLTKHVNTALLGALALVVFFDCRSLWLIDGLALAIGLATAFSLPAATSIMPHVVPREWLGKANGIMMGARQLSMFLGPLFAGVLIAVFGQGAKAADAMPDSAGVAAAFAVDALSFIVSAWTLSKVVTRDPVGPVAAVKEKVWSAVSSGLAYVWRDASLRTCFCYWAAVALFISGPIQVAIPVLAHEVGSSASALGMLAGAYGAGSLAGMVASIARPGLRIIGFGATILLLDGVIGLLFVPLGLIRATWQGLPLLLAIGLLGGYLQVMVFSWLQRRIKPSMMGRTMALFMFIMMGVAPMSSSVTGWLLRSISLRALFAYSGCLLVLIVLATAVLSGMRSVTDAAAESP
ncbi:MFS transporter [Noviherbaspirillum galbum]|uniref:MFS transporter n=1 Tax=Noviherbaspirillum galbum TaxID=2709383 RepID=A0A6B3SWT1_9BURK|nr:MFS transporter [Noviherbaspirillum galbum]NEX63935.1 MFS transporter [Noviherbaspirillum galbum]